jgi:N,N'-diacetyllegionaminate synthase
MASGILGYCGVEFMATTLVIAEPGCTAEGDKATMLRLLETAHQCGANVWKPQWTSDPVQMCERRHIGPDHPKRAYYEAAYRWLAWPVEWHAEFGARCRALGMEYACTAFLPQDVATVAPFVDYLKISSFEAMDSAMPRIVMDGAGFDPSEVIVSTGMLDRDDAPEWYGANMLHCVSAYPAPIGAMNLRVLEYDKYAASDFDGLSDHSRHLLTGAVAVGAGAAIIETHYRLDTCHPTNPDYAVAFTPAEFTQYVKNIRDAEAMMGDGVKKRQPCEEWAVPYRVTR